MNSLVVSSPTGAAITADVSGALPPINTVFSLFNISSTQNVNLKLSASVTVVVTPGVTVYYLWTGVDWLVTSATGMGVLLTWRFAEAHLGRFQIADTTLSNLVFDFSTNADYFSEGITYGGFNRVDFSVFLPYSAAHIDPNTTDYIYPSTSDKNKAAFAIYQIPTADINISTGVFTVSSHDFTNGVQVMIIQQDPADLPPAPLSFGKPYWIVNRAANTFQLSPDIGGTPVSTLSSTGSYASGKMYLVTPITSDPY